MAALAPNFVVRTSAEVEGVVKYLQEKGITGARARASTRARAALPQQRPAVRQAWRTGQAVRSGGDRPLVLVEGLPGAVGLAGVLLGQPLLSRVCVAARRACTRAGAPGASAVGRQPHVIHRPLCARRRAAEDDAGAPPAAARVRRAGGRRRAAGVRRRARVGRARGRARRQGGQRQPVARGGELPDVARLALAAGRVLSLPRCSWPRRQLVLEGAAYWIRVR
jgi:hypothetical protein